ncbi:MAG: hypothetical protein C4551_07635 [Bacillota bacterium]|nr:MAG: hypothetical protein C4551_07635 [Bacillota bacterium]
MGDALAGKVGLIGLAVPVLVGASAVLYALSALGAYLSVRERRWNRYSAWAAQGAWVAHTVALLGGALFGGRWTVWSAAPGAMLLVTWLAASSYQVSDALLREAGKRLGPRGQDGPGPQMAPTGLGLFLFPAIAVGLVLADVVAGWASGGLIAGPDRSVLEESWVPVHAILAATGWGLFTLAWVANLMYTTQDRSLRKLRLGPLSRLLPSLEVLDRVGLRLVVAGLLFLVAGLIPGIARAVSLWGATWFADPKVISTFLAVLAYAFHLVARVRLGWTARRASWVLNVGFILTAVNLLVATPLLSRFHQWL